LEVLKQLETLPIVTKRKDNAMPMGKGTYGSQRGRPKKKANGKKTNGKKLTKKQMSLPASLRKRIMKAM